MYPTISIVTCSFQQARYLDATIRSVTSQNYKSLQYIVMDGGSTDGSKEIIKKHESDLAYWVSEPDEGQSDALIKGFNQSTGEIMGWLCSDDLLLPDTLNTVGRFFAENPEVLVVYGNSLWIDASGQYLRPKIEPGFNRLAFLYDHNYIPQPSMFWRRSIYDAVGGLDKNLHLAMDSDLWDKFSQLTHIAHIPDFLSCMRYYPEQKTRSLTPQRLAEDEKIRFRSGPVSGAKLKALRVAGRLARISAKLAVGGYTSQPDPRTISALSNYLIAT
jgi:glycosyltransferase involved in cell wall biosynthesis